MEEDKILKLIGKIADDNNINVWAVGGFVRDKLLNVSVKDIDFVVVGDGLDFAKKVIDILGVGKLVVFERFHTAMIHYKGFQLEFVSARSESYKSDSRKPIVRSADLYSDLSRRDFTINTIAFGLNSDNFGELADPFNGQDDIQKKIIRTPLDPEITFSEDPLRILRAIRFATRLNFNIESDVLAALKKMAYRLEIISQERITEELLHILKAKTPSIGFHLLDEAGILRYIFPELDALKGVEQRDGFHHKDIFQHTLKVTDNVASVSDNLNLRFTALVHDIGKPATKKFVADVGWTFHGHEDIGARMLKSIFRRLRLPNKMLTYVENLVRLHLRPIALSNEEVTDSAVRRLLVQANEQIDDLLILCRADITSGNPDRVKQHLANFEYVMKRIAEVEEKDKMRAFKSPVDGKEIMQVCNILPGPKVGKLKMMIEEAILNGEIANDHDAAFEYLLKIKNDIRT